MTGLQTFCEEKIDYLEEYMLKCRQKYIIWKNTVYAKMQTKILFHVIFISQN